MRRRTLPVIALAAATALVACTEQSGDGPDGGPDATTAPPEPTAPELQAPEETTVLGESDAADLALATSQAFFATAPVVVVAPAGDAEAQSRAAAAAVALGMPFVLAPQESTGEDAGTAEDGAPEGDATEESSPDGDASPEPDGETATEQDDAAATALADEIDRLQAEAALTFGSVSAAGLDVDVVEAPADDAALAELLGASEVEVETGDPLLALLELTPGELGNVATTTEDGATEDAEGTDDPAATETDEATTGEQATEDEATDEATDGAAGQELPATTPAEPLEDVLVLSTGEEDQLAAVATVRAAQAAVEVIPAGDPRATSESVQALAESDHGTTVGLGAAFGDAETLDWQVATAATGTELPGGGQLVLPGKTYVALYGNPTTGALGVLGEQGPEATIERAREHAAPYEELTDTTVVPALEIIATVASAGAGDDGNYSSERPISELRPLVDLARENGQYVVLDLQPGRTDFVTQAELYSELLREPHVGLALDPEWRLEPDEVHLRQIGQVDVAEVNDVVTWLADFTREHQLPQKMLILHQFQVRMIPGVDDVDLSRPELAVLIHVDGQGSQPAKQDTWRVLHNHAPDVQYWGWKNFYDEDLPMLTPEQTMQVEPAPEFISYQ